jgi:PleD family two-component response regulator
MEDIKKRLFNIPELNIVRRLGGMEGGQLEQYVSKLKEFVDRFPETEKKLRTCLENKNLDTVIDIVRSLGNLLSEIYADNLAEEVNKHVNDFKNLTFERVKAYVVYLISILISLSIDIQMATITDEAKRAVVSKTASGNAVKMILTVDDDSFCLDTLKNTLTGVQCNIMCATNGSTALNILRTHKPDLFVLDIDMPGMNGLELAEKLRSLGYNEPIIFITGNADKNYVIKAVNAGGSDFIVKPFNPQNVVTRIKRFL